MSETGDELGLGVSTYRNGGVAAVGDRVTLTGDYKVDPTVFTVTRVYGEYVDVEVAGAWGQAPIASTKLVGRSTGND
jgi:hypothetical protein